LVWEYTHASYGERPTYGALVLLSFAVVSLGVPGTVPEELTTGNSSTIILWRVRCSSRFRGLWQVLADGTNLHPLLAGWRQPNHKSDISGLSGECCGRWTPDGKYFVFDSGGQLWALREKESLLRKVSREPMQLTSGAINYGFPIPSKDGRK